MKTECSVVRDLLPLYVENMVNPDTAQYIETHLAECSECQAVLDSLKAGGNLPEVEPKAAANTDGSKPFKKIMKRMNRKLYMLSYSLIIFFIFLGFAWTGEKNMMYNSLIMPVVGIFGYYVFGWRAVYKVPILLLIIDMFVYLFKLVELSLYSAFMWTMTYSIFVLIGIAIAFLLQYAFGKGKK